MRQKEALLARCRAEHIEPPGRADRIINSANATADEPFVDAGFTITDLQHVHFPDLRLTPPTSANILGTALRA